MKKDQLEGRIGSWAEQRRATYEFVTDLLPALREASRAVADPLKKTTNKKIAAWLNVKGYKSIRNAKFHGPTIDRIVYDTGEKLRAFAQHEHDTGKQIVLAERLPDWQARKLALAQTLADRLAEAATLDRELKQILLFTPPDGIAPSQLPAQSAQPKRIKVSNSRKRLGAIWNNIRRICDDRHAVGYEGVGSRGIQVCKDWLEDFDAFAEWSLTHGYSNKKSLNRIDEDADYTPSNCEWR